MDQENFPDRGYKLLFSQSRMVEDLIRSFVREEFVLALLTRTMCLI